MKIVAWNIQGGGGKRISGIASKLIEYAADVVVLGEYIPGRSDPLIDLMSSAGWVHQVLPEPPERYGGVAVVSRVALEPLEDTSDLGPQAHFRHIGVTLLDAGIQLRGIYGPLHADPYDAFWEGLQASLNSQRHLPVLVMGDFNSGSPLFDTPGTKLFCSHHFNRLSEAGYTDLWRRIHGCEACEYTWQCSRKGEIFPFRLDHAFGSQKVVDRLDACKYDHEVRLSKLSDHSLLSVEVSSRDLDVQQWHRHRQTAAVR